MSSQSSLHDPTQVPTSVEIKVPGGGGGGAAFLPGPHRDPRRLRGRRGRQHQPQRAEPGNFRERFALAGERQTPTRLSLSQQVPSSPPGADTSAPAAAEVSAVRPGPRPGLSCRNFARPFPLPPSGARSPRRPEQGRGAGRGERRGGPPGRGADSRAHEGRKGRRGHRAQRGAAHFSCAGKGVAQTARAWMRRSPSRGGRGAARAGDARREGRPRSGRRMAEVSGRAGDGREAA